MNNRTLRNILLCSLLLAGSAARASPQDVLAEGQAAVINAIVAGAEARAPHLLDRARHNLQLARDSIARHDFARARQLARQAIADAAAAESGSLAVREARLDADRGVAAPH